MRGTGVFVTAIMPGVVDTVLAAGTSSGAAKRLTPAEVARAVLRSASGARFEVPIPGFIGPAVKIAALLPTAVRDKVFGALVPDQVRQMRPEERRGYEAGFSEQR